MLNKSLGIIGSAFMAGAIFASAMPAEAAPSGENFSIGNCTNGIATYGLLSFNACTNQQVTGLNPMPQPNPNTPTGALNYLNNGVFNGITNWIFNSKIEVGASPSGSNFLGFNIALQDESSGQWGFSNTNYTGPIVLELKASNYAAYYYFQSLTGAASLLGQWNTAGVTTGSNGQIAGLSHASLFYTQPRTTPVPEPLGMLGTVVATGVGLGLKRKQSAKAQT